MNNKRYGRIITGISSILVLIMCWYIWSTSKNEIDVPEEYKDNIVIYENGDYVYVPGEEHLSYSYDEGDYLLYFDNEIVVYTEADFGKQQKRELANAVDGAIVGEINGYINMVQIAFAEADFDEIGQKANQLLAYEGVMYAMCDYPLLMETTAAKNLDYVDNNPWSSNKDEEISDKGNEEEPYGNDWWAEAIGAYTAWGYAQDAVPVNVGIIDDGFDLEHEELVGRISMLEAFPWNEEESSHGTSVAGIIGAADNDMGLRGVCSNARMICADWSLDDGNIFEDEDGNYTSAVFSEIINQMAQQGVKVVNLSVSLTVKTLEKYTKGTGGFDYFQKKFSYQKYLATKRGMAKRSACTCMMLIDQLIKNDGDILFVQGAGNGWNNGGDNGYEADKYAGLFTSITEEVYEHIFFYSFGYCTTPYTEIKDHILIVGAVDNIRNVEGDYQMTQFSNHGDSVDICAPGETIFTTSNESFDLEYNYVFSGTSASAPMVTGSAALLWGINPELTAAEVKDLLISSAQYDAFGYYFDTMRYPMLNVGNAAKMLYEEMNLADNDTILSDWLESLTKQCNVIEVGTEEYYSTSGDYGHVVPDSRITGLLAADMDDYDGDGCNELFVVRVEPYAEKIDGYSTGPTQEIYKTDISLEVYDVQNGEICESSYMTFPLLGLSETEYQTAVHVFKTTDEDGIKLYFDHFFSFNSQTFATIQLEYIDGDLYVTDGVELSEFAYSAGCYRAVSDAACGTILGRQSYDIGQDGWKEYCSGYWDDYGDKYEEVIWDTFQEYDTLLSNMGLTESVSRSMYWGDWDGGSYASLQAEYGCCYLRPVEHFTVDGGSIQAICSLIAPYGQGSVTLTVEDETELLYPYRTGKNN